MIYYIIILNFVGIGFSRLNSIHYKLHYNLIVIKYEFIINFRNRSFKDSNNKTKLYKNKSYLIILPKKNLVKQLI